MRFFLIALLIALPAHGIQTELPNDGDRPTDPKAEDTVDRPTDSPTDLPSTVSRWGRTGVLVGVGAFLVLGMGTCAYLLHSGATIENKAVEDAGDVPKAERDDLFSQAVIAPQLANATRLAADGDVMFVRKGYVFRLGAEGTPKPLHAFGAGKSVKSVLTHDGKLFGLLKDGQAVLYHPTQGWIPLTANVTELASRDGKLYALTPQGVLKVYQGEPGRPKEGNGGMPFGGPGQPTGEYEDAFHATGIVGVLRIRPATDSQQPLVLENRDGTVRP